MTIHCFDVIYSPSSEMDNSLSDEVDSWTVWNTNNQIVPDTDYFKDSNGNIVEVSGFRTNRFELRDSSKSIQNDAESIVSNLTGSTGYLASYCDWWIVRWHPCRYDETNDTSDCGNWKILDMSNDYTGYSSVPDEVKP